jgi:hemoglobin-like flavoprotein
MALDVQLLRDSFQLVLERHPEPTARFYEILFEQYPAARALFGRNSRKNQEAMLAQALLAVLDHLEDGAWLERTLGALGEKHNGYGVTPEMYDWVGGALIATFAEIVGKEWTTLHTQAWGTAYGIIVSIMLRGDARAAE